MRLALLPLMVTRSCPVPLIVRFLSMVIWPFRRGMVWGELKREEKTTVSPEAAAETASRSEQSASHTPSFVSSTFVTVSVAAQVPSATPKISEKSRRILTKGDGTSVKFCLNYKQKT